MSTELYCGYWKPTNGITDWLNPHTSHEDSAAIVISKSGRIVTVNQIIIRNHGDETVYNLADVFLYARAFSNTLPQVDTAANTTMDGQTLIDFPPGGVIPGRPLKWELVWENRTVPCYSDTNTDQALTILENGQVIQWTVPPGYTSVCLVVAIRCTELGQFPQYAPSQDRCIGIKRTSIP